MVFLISTNCEGCSTFWVSDRKNQNSHTFINRESLRYQNNSFLIRINWFAWEFREDEILNCCRWTVHHHLCLFLTGNPMFSINSNGMLFLEQPLNASEVDFYSLNITVRISSSMQSFQILSFYILFSVGCTSRRIIWNVSLIYVIGVCSNS